MYLHHNIENDLVINVEQIHYRGEIIDKLKKRFLTYGYSEIFTSTFENYDLYAGMNGTVNHQEMIKTIDNTGQVLVLRPDITIPITHQIAMNNKHIQKDLRYFYVLDVFRQVAEVSESRESTQAGVEYFGNPSPEADAEIIALAIQLFQDVQTANFKIELGHAGFFKQLTSEMDLNPQDLKELKQYIQAKNITEIEQFLKRLSIDDRLREIVTSLPFLYGNPLEVIKKTKQLRLSDTLTKTLNNIAETFQVLRAYGVAKHVVIDLSLINHMDYYSDLIFQGFVENVGKPVLMGGRYDSLANQFGATIPAIGFACDIDSLLAGVQSEKLPEMHPVEIALIYEKEVENEALTLANKLRNTHVNVLTYTNSVRKNRIPETMFSIMMNKEEFLFINKDERTAFSTFEDVLVIRDSVRERT